MQGYQLRAVAKEKQLCFTHYRHSCSHTFLYDNHFYIARHIQHLGLNGNKADNTSKNSRRIWNKKQEGTSELTRRDVTKILKSWYDKMEK